MHELKSFPGLIKRYVVYVCVAKERSATHMTILEDLYYGNVSPCDRDVKRGSKIDKLQILVCQYEVELTIFSIFYNNRGCNM